MATAYVGGRTSDATESHKYNHVLLIYMQLQESHAFTTLGIDKWNMKLQAGSGDHILYAI